MGKRNAPKQDDSSHLPWQNFKAIIITLYSSENQSLQETMETLANDYNFYATYASPSISMVSTYYARHG